VTLYKINHLNTSQETRIFDMTWRWSRIWYLVLCKLCWRKF